MASAKPTVFRARRSAIKLQPRQALAEVRKAVPKPTQIEESARRYRRTSEKQRTRRIVANEIEGC